LIPITGRADLNRA